MAEAKSSAGCGCLTLIAASVLLTAVILLINGCTQRQLDAQPHGVLLSWSLLKAVDTGQDGRVTLCDPAPSQPSYLAAGTNAVLTDTDGHTFGTARVSRYTDRGTCGSSVEFNDVTGLGPYTLRLGTHSITVTADDDETESVHSANAGLGTLPKGNRDRFYDLGFLP